MEAINEQVAYDNPMLSLKIFHAHRRQRTMIDWHFHKQLEMLFILNGQLDLYTEAENYSLNKNDVIIIGTSELHRDYSAGKVEYIVLQFDLEHFFDQSSISYMKYFTETHTPLSKLNYIFKQNDVIKKEIGNSMRRILEEYTDKQVGYELSISILIKQILLLLLRNDTEKILAEQDAFEVIRLKPVLNYVEDHLTDRIQVEDVCRIANMSYYYFVKYFKKTIGLSFTEYVNYRKIKKAEKLLLTKDLSIFEVGEQIGMPNMAHFYKVFKKYNECSPKQYQKQKLHWKAQ